jgi:hypothetical protein
MNNLTENDKHAGPLTFGSTPYRMFHVTIASADVDEPTTHAFLRIYGFGWAFRLALPAFIKPANQFDHNTDLVQTWPRYYGFSLTHGFLQLFYGRRTYESQTTQAWSCCLPWYKTPADKQPAREYKPYTLEQIKAINKARANFSIHG